MNHPDLVTALIKPGEEIVDEMTPEKANLWHLASCVPGKAGELFDAVKKHAIYGKELDLENVIEELGDLEFYLEGIRQALKISRQLTLDRNVSKLSLRYSQMRFRNEDARARADKK
jgi:NTP pyrophosphatase (non-canonical NTP hydrolase)